MTSLACAHEVKSECAAAGGAKTGPSAKKSMMQLAIAALINANSPWAHAEVSRWASILTDYPVCTLVSSVK